MEIVSGFQVGLAVPLNMGAEWLMPTWFHCRSKGERVGTGAHLISSAESQAAPVCMRV
jgi:hypothetical protein